MPIIGIDHIQLALPAGQEQAARDFYTRLLGLREASKPPDLAAQGGVWFEGDHVKIHLGVDPEFRPARKAHPGLLVSHLEEMVRRLAEAGVDVIADELLPGYDRVYVHDPFGNRLELLEPHT